MPGGYFNHPAGNSFLKPASAFRDIAKVGALCRQLRTRLREGRVWKAHAERLSLRYGLKISVSITKFNQIFPSYPTTELSRLRLPVCAALVHYAKKHNLEGRHYKIIIGIAAELQRSVVELREACQKYAEARRDEETRPSKMGI